jgi:hypothetical protein
MAGWFLGVGARQTIVVCGLRTALELGWRQKNDGLPHS